MDDRKIKRVLVVDDDLQFAEATRIALERRGYEVFLAHDGHQGLVSAERESPDLIVLDVMMPRRSGFGVLERVRRQSGAGPRIVMITANEEPRHQEFATSRGADAFLQKPFDLRDLIAAVDRLLQV
jgi:DNA-binding response OmpR family regulator